MIRRFCLHVRVNKLQHQKGIWLPILYHELNKDDTILVQGWVKDTGSEGQSQVIGTWHLWCETCAGDRVDPHMVLFDMDEIDYKLDYTTEEPEKIEKDDEVVESWELYEKDPQEFWKKQSSEVRSFRSKIFSLVKKKKF